MNENGMTSQPTGAVAQNDEAEIDLLELLLVLRSKLLQIIAAFLAGGILAGAFSYFLIAPTYVATSRLYVISTTGSSLMSLADLQIGTQLTSDYNILLGTRTVLEQVIEDLQLDMSYEQMSSMVSISNPSDTRVLNINVTSTDPQLSCDIANQVAKVARDYLPTVMDASAPNVAEPAVVPSHKSGPSNTRNALLGALVGAVICAGIYVLFFLMDDTLKSSEDVEKYFDIRPLASIPEVEWSTSANAKKDKSSGLFGKKSKKTAKTKG